MGWVLFAFASMFVLIAAGGLILFYREAMIQRISEVINPRPKPKGILSSIQESGFSLGGVVEHFESVLPKSQAEQSVMKQRLIRAGFREDSAAKTFYGFKVVVPLLLCSIGWVTGLVSMNPFFVLAIALGLGGDLRRLGDDQSRGCAFSIIVRGEGAGNESRARAIAGERRHDDAVGELEGADLDTLE